jgi:hypothetical protein
MRQPQARKHQVCDHCGRRFGMVTHRWWGGKFCKRTCKDAYLREVTLDRETIRRWFCPQVSRAAQAVGGAALWAQSMTSSVQMIGRLAGGISRKNIAATTIAMTGCYIIVTTLTMALLHRLLWTTTSAVDQFQTAPLDASNPAKKGTHGAGFARPRRARSRSRRERHQAADPSLTDSCIGVWLSDRNSGR